MTNRPTVTEQDTEIAMLSISKKLDFRMKQKGREAFASKHEILGIINEEYYELVKAIHENSDPEKLCEELKDIAVACAFGIASIQSGGTDW